MTQTATAVLAQMSALGRAAAGENNAIYHVLMYAGMNGGAGEMSQDSGDHLETVGGRRAVVGSP